MIRTDDTSSSVLYIATWDTDCSFCSNKKPKRGFSIFYFNEKKDEFQCTSCFLNQGMLPQPRHYWETRLFKWKDWIDMEETNRKYNYIDN